MKLICKICAQANDVARDIGKDNIIAEVHTDQLRLPVHGGMFGSPDTIRGVPTPWPVRVEWNYMFCPKGGKHLPWGMTAEEIQQAYRDGGPREILTDMGRVRLTRDGFEIIEDEGQADLEVGKKEVFIEESEALLINLHPCPHCDKSYRQKSSLNRHIKREHPDK